ncbi:MAG: response regulator [Candidatus Binatia bacterium]
MEATGEADTILVVDDHIDTCEVMRLMLEGEGYRVATAHDGREALMLLFGGLKPCVIVMDLTMPVMNGVEFRAEQLKHATIASIPFIAYSAVDDVRDSAPQLRAADYIDKPSELRHVLSIIRQHCNHELSR